MTGALLIRLAVVASLLTLPQFGTAADRNPALEFQGEYSGAVMIEGTEIQVGTQVVALGGDKFNGVAFVGGLPGAGWDGSARREGLGTLQGGTVVFDHKEILAKAVDGKIEVSDKSGQSMGVLSKVERKSPTLGAKPPAGATVLLGEPAHVDEFPGARLSPEGWLMQGATSRQTFQDFSLHLEFQTSFMPDAASQGRSNSGCYCQGRYEVQILDSFGLEGKSNECGGIYSVKAPDINMCYPPLAWQTYDIDFKAARFAADGKKTANAKLTVKHNGVAIHREVAVPGITTAAPVPEGPEAGPLFLQDHGDQVRFRNIWIVTKP